MRVDFGDAIKAAEVDGDDHAVARGAGFNAASDVGATAERNENDTISVRFDRSMSPWGILDMTNYTVNDGSTDITLDYAEFTFDGDLTVTIDLDSVGADNLQVPPEVYSVQPVMLELRTHPGR